MPTSDEIRRERVAEALRYFEWGTLKGPNPMKEEGWLFMADAAIKAYEMPDPVSLNEQVAMWHDSWLNTGGLAYQYPTVTEYVATMLKALYAANPDDLIRMLKGASS